MSYASELEKIGMPSPYAEIKNLRAKCAELEKLIEAKDYTYLAVEKDLSGAHYDVEALTVKLAKYEKALKIIAVTDSEVGRWAKRALRDEALADTKEVE